MIWFCTIAIAIATVNFWLLSVYVFYSVKIVFYTDPGPDTNACEKSKNIYESAIAELEGRKDCKTACTRLRRKALMIEQGKAQ